MKLQSCKRREFVTLAHRVRRLAGLPPGVRVRFHHVAPLHGASDARFIGWTTKLSSRGFSVHITDNLTHEHTADLLIHELAHVRDWVAHGEQKVDHNPRTFGKYWAEIYCSYVGTS